MIKSALSAIFGPYIGKKSSSKHKLQSTAHRIGPQRVILQLALNDNFKGFDIDRLDVASRSLQYYTQTQKNENVSVSLIQLDATKQHKKTVRQEHRFTLKVQPQTTQITLTFRHQNKELEETEIINIE